MSAIRMMCPNCGATYFAGMVGSTPWPAHVCPKQYVKLDPAGGLLAAVPLKETTNDG